MGFDSKTGKTGNEQVCAISVGEHVWVTGRDGEYVVVGVDQENGRLQVLKVGSLRGLESVLTKNVRAVLVPKAGDAKSNAA